MGVIAGRGRFVAAVSGVVARGVGDGGRARPAGDGGVVGRGVWAV